MLIFVKYWNNIKVATSYFLGEEVSEEGSASALHGIQRQLEIMNQHLAKISQLMEEKKG